MSACLVCAATEAPRRWAGLVRCARCAFVSADLELSDDELAKIYGHDYFHGAEYLDYVAEEQSLRWNFRQRLTTLRAIAPDLAERDLLEIGCAYGFFLDEARTWVHSAAGIDISADAVRHARAVLGVDARQGDYLSLDLGRPVGVVALWDTIEHLRRPDLVIAKAAVDLPRGGWLVLTTGDLGSLNARMRGRKWRMIHPPTHLHYFSASTMRTLLDRRGFETVHLSHPGVTRNLRAVLYYLLVWRARRTAWYEALSPWRLLDLRLAVNLFDVMYVIARRR